MDPMVINMILENQKELRGDVRELDEKIDKILEWKWKLVGSTVIISGALTIMFQVALTIYSNAK